MKEQQLDQEQLQQTCGYGPLSGIGLEFRAIRVLNDLSEEYVIPHLIFQIYTE